MGRGWKAIVVLTPGATLTEQEIINHCRTNLARYKVPQTVEFIDEIPHNATGRCSSASYEHNSSRAEVRGG
ncbi:MAG: hypothetical protein R2710_25380 [Acidimicrobiales bacterium]